MIFEISLQSETSPFPNDIKTYQVEKKDEKTFLKWVADNYFNFKIKKASVIAASDVRLNLVNLKDITTFTLKQDILKGDFLKYKLNYKPKKKLK